MQRSHIINTHGSKDSTLCLVSYFFGIPLLRSRQITNPIKKILAYKYGCKHIMAAAHVIKNSLVASGINKNKITVVGEGVDLNEFILQSVKFAENEAGIISKFKHYS